MPDGDIQPRLRIGAEPNLVLLSIRRDLLSADWFALHPDDAIAWAEGLKAAAIRAKGEEEAPQHWLALLRPDGRELSAPGYQRILKPSSPGMVVWPEPREEWGWIAAYAEFDAAEGGQMIGRPVPMVMGKTCRAPQLVPRHYRRDAGTDAESCACDGWEAHRMG